MNDRRKVTQALIDMLAAATTRPVGDLDRPPAGVEPFAVVYPIPGGSSDGPAQWPHADVDRVYQVSSVGKDRWQAEWMADKVRAAILGRNGNGAYVNPITVDGVVVFERDEYAQGAPIREGALVSIGDRYVLRTTPA
ncbi:MAG TPA: hypothetical protein VGB14_00355 [Acidimicrobiales bacterium]